MKIVADNFTVSNPEIQKNLYKFNHEYFYNFFNKILKTTTLIDLNLGQIRKNLNDLIKFIFEILNSFNRELTIFIDTVNITAIEICLKYSKNPPILNSLSFDRMKIDNILPIAVENNLKVVCLIIEKNIPLTVEEKIELTYKIIEEFTKRGLKEENIILDPVVVPLGWENGPQYNLNNLEFLKIKNDAFSENIETMMGISNLTTRSVGKTLSVKKLDTYYLSMAYSLGLNYALMNVFNRELLNLVKFIDILENNKIFTSAMFENE